MTLLEAGSLVGILVPHDIFLRRQSIDVVVCLDVGATPRRFLLTSTIDRRCGTPRRLDWWRYHKVISFNVDTS